MARDIASIKGTFQKQDCTGEWVTEDTKLFLTRFANGEKDGGLQITLQGNNEDGWITLNHEQIIELISTLQEEFDFDNFLRTL